MKLKENMLPHLLILETADLNTETCWFITKVTTLVGLYLIVATSQHLLTTQDMQNFP